VQVVFLDIVSYSKRKTTIQRALVETFQADVKEALNSVGRKYLEYSQANDLNLMNDVVRIPTGDGAALVFTFDGVPTIALDFALALLSIIYDKTEAAPCQKFSENSWCNCHTHYLVRIGINEGKAIIFNDMNGQVNVAGSGINLASRVMGFADGGQIVLSNTAYVNLIDMSNDVALDDQFRALGTMKIKHGEKVETYQYVGTEEPFINREAPVPAAINQKMESMMSVMGLGGMSDVFSDPKAALQLAETMSKVAEMIGVGIAASPSPKMKTIKSVTP
jgi:hypothetical protein